MSGNFGIGMGNNIDFESARSSIGGAYTSVGEAQTALTKAAEDGDTAGTLDASFKLMEANQRLTALIEGITKTMKAIHDAVKSCIQNAH